MASSEEEIPGTPIKNKSKLIGGLSGKVPLTSKQQFVPVKRKVSDSSEEENNSTKDLSKPNSKENSSNSPSSKPAKFCKGSSKEYIASESESESQQSPLKPLYSGSPHWPGDAQDVFLMYDSQRSSTPDSSVPSETSVCILSPLGSPTISETSEDTLL